MHSNLDRLTELRICYQVRVDVRTLRKEWRYPGTVRGLVGAALREALAELRHSSAAAPPGPTLGVDRHEFEASR